MRLLFCHRLESVFSCWFAHDSLSLFILFFAASATVTFSIYQHVFLLYHLQCNYIYRFAVRISVCLIYNWIIMFQLQQQQQLQLELHMLTYFARLNTPNALCSHTFQITERIKHVQQAGRQLASKTVRFVFSWNYDRRIRDQLGTCVQWWFYVHIRLKITINAIILSILRWSVFSLAFCFIFTILCVLPFFLFHFVLCTLANMLVAIAAAVAVELHFFFFAIHSHSIYVHARKTTRNVDKLFVVCLSLSLSLSDVFYRHTHRWLFSENWAVEISFFLNAISLFFSTKQSLNAYAHCANALYLFDKYRALGDFWLKYSKFQLWHRAFYVRANSKRKTK